MQKYNYTQNKQNGPKNIKTKSNEKVYYKRFMILHRIYICYKSVDIL